MNKYELALVVSAKIDDDARTAVVDKAKANTNTCFKLRLAYEIQKMKEGFYYFIQFDANAEAPAQIEASVRIMESVLRYLCVRQDAE